MFERYTEKARRVIFFARYEASQYGSPYIETEHLLLGLLREDRRVERLLPNMKTPYEIRRGVEQHIEIRERISTSVEVPLSTQCKRALNLAAEEATCLGSEHVGTEHLLLALLQIKDGLAAQILQADEALAAQLRTRLSGIKTPGPAASATGDQTLDNFLAAVRNGSLEELENYFGSGSCFVDACGKLWRGQEEIIANFDSLLAPFAKRSAKTAAETTIYTDAFLWIATVIWEDVHLAGFSPLDLFRMSVVFGTESGAPIVYLLQITPIGREAQGKSAAT